MIDTDKWASARIADEMAIYASRDRVNRMISFALKGLALSERGGHRRDGTVREAFGNRPNGLMVLQHCQLIAIRERIDGAIGEDW